MTQTYLDTQNRLSDGTNGQSASTANPNGSDTDPFYVDCTTGEFEFTVPTDVAADHKTNETLAYELSVERGGVFATFNNNTGAQPEFVFQATPIAYDPTNQFNVPGVNGNSQYTPNVKSNLRMATVTVTASSPAAITAGNNFPSISFTTNPSPITWITEPTCAVYASSDTSYSSALTGVSTAGTYVTHCTGGTSARYVPTQANGSFTVLAAGATLTSLPNLSSLTWSGAAGSRSTYSPAFPYLFVTGNIYQWWASSSVSFYVILGETMPDGRVVLGTTTLYFSPDGAQYTAFPQG